MSCKQEIFDFVTRNKDRLTFQYQSNHAERLKIVWKIMNMVWYNIKTFINSNTLNLPTVSNSYLCINVYFS